MKEKKKILLLGGSAQQIIAIETARKMGYYTILCDFLSDNPGQFVADKFYLASTTDKDKILEIAKDEKIDGILAYASDPAAPTAAFVAEKLSLPGNPYESVEILCNKDKFRKFLKDHNFNTPKAKGYNDIEKAIKDIENDYFKFPIIVKPVDSSGSKGVRVLYDIDDIKKALEFSLSFSRSKKIIIEEYIEKKHKYLIGGDIFVINGKIVVWGLLNCHRDSNVNCLVPIGKSYPLYLENEDIENVKRVLQNLVTKLKIDSGAMNVELVIDKNNDVYPIDIGPRNGGNMIPDLLGYIFNIDIVKMTIKVAMGKKIKIDTSLSNPFFATYNLHSKDAGIFKTIEFSNEIQSHIIRKCIYKKEGDIVEYFDNSAKALGIIFLKFESMDEMLDMMDNLGKWVNIILK